MPLIRNKRKNNIRKSGAITLLPKNQLLEIDNLQGQIPIDLSIDGKQLLDTTQYFDDGYLNYNFSEIYANTKGPSAGLPDSDSNTNFFISTPNSLGIDYFTNLRVSKNSIKDDRLKRRIQKSQSPFKEENQLDLNNQSSFYLTSSNPDIIKNFDQPIKNRTVIDLKLESSAPVTIKQSSIDDEYNFMAYYNFSSKNWDILDGTYTEADFAAGSFDSKDFHIGFSPTVFGDGDINTGGGSNATREYISGSISEPISNFGFPICNKYKGTSSQTLDVKNYINKPLLLEKIIIEFNYSSSGNTKELNDNLLPFIVGNNFFILNQKETNSNRRFGNITDITSFSQVSNDSFSSITNNGYYGTNDSSVREIITYSKIILATTGIYDISINNTNSDLSKAQNESDYYEYIDSTSADCSYSISNKRIKVEFPVRVANKSKYFSKFIDIFVGNEFGTRTLLGEDFNRSFYRNNDSHSGIDRKYNGTSSTTKFSNLENPNRESPYILLPDDKIIFGFHSLTNVLGKNTNSFTIEGDVDVKLIGTPLSNYTPVEETRREFQTSNNLRSNIIGNTFLSDRFETSPIQLYASSSIDRIITSDSSRDLGRSLSTFYSNGDLGTNKKAVQISNNDILNVFEDNVLSKASQFAYFDWRRFGHMSDFIDQGKNTAYVNNKNNQINYLAIKKFFNIETGLKTISSISNNSDNYCRISTPFAE